MEALVQNLNYVAAFASALLALHILTAKPVYRAPSVLLALGFMILATQSLLVNLVAVYGRQNLGGLLMPCFALLIGPVFFVTFKSLVNTTSQINWRSTIHILPAFLTLLMLSFKRVVIDIDLLIIASFVVYSLLLIKMVSSGEQQFAHLGKHSRVVFRWLVAVCSVMVLALVSELLIFNELLRGHTLSSHSLKGSVTLLLVSVIKLLSLGLVLFSALQNPSMFDWLYSLGGPKKRSDINPALEQTAADFVELVETQRLYADEQVSLRFVSQQMAIPTRQLSQAINLVFSQSFSKYMNVRRVAEAKRLLETSSGNITQLMYESGFRTKSNFNKEFRAIEGVSPSEYRERFALSND